MSSQLQLESCKVATVPILKTISLTVACSHVFNAAWAAGCFSSLDPDFGNSHQKFENWAAFGARLRTANPTAFAWENETMGYEDTNFDITNTKFSVDYLSPHKDEGPRKERPCSTNRHSFALELSEDPGIADISAHTVCSHRISVHCKKGRRVEEEEFPWRINPYEPPNTLIIFEDSGHDETSLMLKPNCIGYATCCNIEWVGRKVIIEYLELIFHHLAA